MNRICVIGSPGAGKSTLSKRLAANLGLPLIHLDKLWWQPGWVEPNPEDFRHRYTEALQAPRWVVDGNFVHFIEERIDTADTIIWLDYSTAVCLYRVLKRVLSQYGQVRSDMALGCPESFDWEFLRFVYRFRRDYRPLLLSHLSRFEGRLLQFVRPRVADAWLRSSSGPER